MTSTKQKVAILGGRLGAMSAAFELAKLEKYEITIYQMGWRLGDKLATGRNMDPDGGYRIQEHGIHSYMGLYLNACGQMQEIYELLDKSSDRENFYTTFSEGFHLQGEVEMWDFADDAWQSWKLKLENNDLTFSDRNKQGACEDQLKAALKLIAKNISVLVESGHINGIVQKSCQVHQVTFPLL